MSRKEQPAWADVPLFGAATLGPIIRPTASRTIPPVARLPASCHRLLFSLTYSTTTTLSWSTSTMLLYSQLLCFSIVSPEDCHNLHLWISRTQTASLSRHWPIISCDLRFEHGLLFSPSSLLSSQALFVPDSHHSTGQSIRRCALSPILLVKIHLTGLIPCTPIPTTTPAISHRFKSDHGIFQVQRRNRTRRKMPLPES